MKKLLRALLGLALSAALLCPPALASSNSGSVTLAYTRSDGTAVLSLEGLDGKTNIYGLQLDLVLDGSYPDAKLIPADPGADSPDKAAEVTDGKTYLTVYLDAQAPLNTGSELVLGTLQGVKDLTMPAAAGLILLDYQLTSISFTGSPTVSTRDAAQSSGGVTPPASPDRTVKADPGGKATLTQKNLKGADSVTVTGGDLSVRLAADALAALRAAGGAVTVTLASTPARDQAKVQRAQTGDAPVYAVRLAAGDEPLAADAPLSLTVPFTGSGSPVAYEVSAAGSLTRLETPAVKDGKVTLEVRSGQTVAVLDVVHQFGDVDGWYDGYVNTMAAKGIMSGMDERTFAPQNTMTRAELVTTLARLSGEPLPAPTADFTDVPADAWFAPYVAWAKQSGVTGGTGDALFQPNGRLTREQLATMLLRFAQKQGVTLTETEAPADFPDGAAISDYAREAAALMQRAGVVGGKGDGSFDPQGTATRAECAKMLSVFLQDMA